MQCRVFFFAGDTPEVQQSRYFHHDPEQHLAAMVDRYFPEEAAANEEDRAPLAPPLPSVPPALMEALPDRSTSRGCVLSRTIPALHMWHVVVLDLQLLSTPISPHAAARLRHMSACSQLFTSMSVVHSGS